MESEEVQEWIEKVQRSREGSIDLSRDEDLSIAIMNIISLEEHFYFTAMKTNSQKYLEMLHSVRELRKKLLGRMVKNPQGEEWCISKHLLASSMRLIETGTKELAKQNNEEANFFFNSAFSLYSMFFAINLKIIEPENLKSVIGKESNKSGIMDKFSLVIKKIVDCCRE